MSEPGFYPQGGGCFRPDEDLELRGQVRIPWEAYDVTATGTTIADALLLDELYPAAICVFGTDVGAGIRLPNSRAGAVYAIYNFGPNAIKLYPALPTANSFLNEGGPGAPVTLAANTSVLVVSRLKQPPAPASLVRAWLTIPHTPSL